MEGEDGRGGREEEGGGVGGDEAQSLQEVTQSSGNLPSLL